MEPPHRLAAYVAGHGPPAQRAWLARVPDVLDDVAGRWGLRVGAPFQPGGVTGWVAPATRHTERVVVKITWTGDEQVESRDEADGLAVWAGGAAVRLLARHATADSSALLLEACEPGTPLRSRPEAEQDVVIAGMLRRLRVRPPSSTFRPLAQMCAWWADAAQRTATGDPGLIRAGLGLFRSLPLDADHDVLLTTDLHAGNVLAARREPWLMIDPKPYVGDPHYDALQHLLNGPQRLFADPHGLVRRFADLCDLDGDRLRNWMFARCVQESPGRPELLDVAQRLAP